MTELINQQLSLQSQILRYWKAVELFNTQTISSKDSPKLTSTTVLPWNKETSEQMRTLQGKDKPTNGEPVKRYTIYCGIYEVKAVQQLLEEKIGFDDDAEYQKPPTGQTCVCSFEVTDEGRPLFDSFTLSSCAWAVGQTLNTSHDEAEWLEGYENMEGAEKLRFSTMFSVKADDTAGQSLSAQGKNIGRVLAFSDIEFCTRSMIGRLGIQNFIPEIIIRIRTKEIKKQREYEVDEQDFINSFFLNDLDSIAKKIEADNQNAIGKALKTYLASEVEINTFQRQDIRQKENIQTVFKLLMPRIFPSGRWASAVEQPLVLSQQIAVNAALQQLSSDAGIFPINGPPGTGKTTLLRDIIAGIVVERAKKLATLQNPADAFAPSNTLTSVSNTQYLVECLKPEFTGYEIVVASSNNGAVENITREIPALEAIDPSWYEYGDYFREFATNLLGEDSWSLTAAWLGKRENRKNFQDYFLWDNNKKKTQGFLSYLKTIAYGNRATYNSLSEDTDRSNNTTPPRESGNNNTESVISWQDAVAKFQRVCEEEQRLRQERGEIFDAYKKMIQLENEININRNDYAVKVQTRQSVLHQVHDAEKTLTKAEEGLQVARNTEIHHHHLRPGFWQCIISFGKDYRQWKQRGEILAKQTAEAEQQFNFAKLGVQEQRNTLQAIEQELDALDAAYQDLRKKLDNVNEILSKAEIMLGSSFPTRSLWNKELWDEKQSERELSSPWADKVWNEARTKVFLEALQLHKAFIQANAGIIEQNLSALSRILAGEFPSKSSLNIVLVAWQTLFFVVPVISTTFASFDRLFKGLGKESLGWLLIDEAGQATPQAAVGALWRSQRAIIVGDPLQLEPVINVPKSVQSILRRHYKVQEAWMPAKTSTQELADRTNRLGTILPSVDRTGYNTELWVGLPLRVHRRCEEPMFSISNKIAYNGLMIFGTPPRESTSIKSIWIDVSYQENINNKGHWIHEEGKKVQSVLNRLMQNGIDRKDIFIITPFRDVEDNLKQLLYEQPSNTIGTIHSFQGREADVVIFVLGGDPQKPGAKDWASKRPNLVNVAVSRAKRHCIIVGNKKTWEVYPNFSECAKHF